MLYQILLLHSLIFHQTIISEIIPFLYINSTVPINPFKGLSISGENLNENDRVKRQSVYYICGVYPNEYYSTVPCSQSVGKCTNGGQPLGVGCISATDCLRAFSGTSTCINGCCCSVPPTTTTQNYYCFTGEPSNVRCSDKSQCPVGKNCMNGLCCTVISEEWKYACGGYASVAACSAQGTCGAGFQCTASKYCCECKVGKSGGRCNNGQCAVGYTCQPNGYCCSSCPGNVTPFGACYNGQCGGGKQCCAGNICC
uniref:EGF-like domain-containing protein n=1 Tax=Strongyloides papillosus TaxID=174720 RepID=A0A0N5B7K0_STREA